MLAAFVSISESILLILAVIAAILAVARVISESFDPLTAPFKALSIFEGVTLKASAD